MLVSRGESVYDPWMVFCTLEPMLIQGFLDLVPEMGSGFPRSSDSRSSSRDGMCCRFSMSVWLFGGSFRDLFGLVVVFPCGNFCGSPLMLLF